MGVTLNTKSLNVEGLDIGTEVVASDVDKWVSGTYQRSRSTYGYVRSWRIDCSENNVTWANSAANSFQTTAKAGTAVNLTITDPPDYEVNLNVYIVGVDIAYESGAPAVRRFTVTCQEAPT